MRRENVVDKARNSLQRIIDRETAKRGISVKRGIAHIPEEMGFLDWCQELANQGMTIDGHRFSLETRKALIPIYHKIPTTREEAQGKVLIIQKGAQIGLTIWETLADIYMGIKFSPITLGMFLPEKALAEFKSNHRFMRIVRSIPQIYNLMTNADGSKGEGNVLTRNILNSIILFLWTSGKLSTESRPMDIVSLDEVQEMTLDAIQKVRERMSNEESLKFLIMLSTANLPELDINYWFLQGTQEVWKVHCRECGSYNDLSDPEINFPGCIEYNNRTNIRYEYAPQDYIWVCPTCRAWIPDTQEGKYIPENPSALIESVLIPQTVTKAITAREFITDWERANTGLLKQVFYNRKLARPFLDKTTVPVTMAHCNAAVELGKRYGIEWEKSGSGYYMGIDQMGGFNAVIIKKRLPNGIYATVHVEAIFDYTYEGDENDPFIRCSVLMEQYGISVCVIEGLPNYNEAKKFANRHKGKVFIASYSRESEDAIVWGDQMQPNDSKIHADERTRYTVRIQQYKMMHSTLHRIKDGNDIFPDPKELIQEVKDGKNKKLIHILQDWVFLHYTKTGVGRLIKEEDNTSKSTAIENYQNKYKVFKLGIDPHYSFATMLCNVALARNYGLSTFTYSDDKISTITRELSEQRQVTLHTQIRDIINSHSYLDIDVGQTTCGSCGKFDADNKYCLLREFLTEPNFRSCDLYDIKD